jgi:hypothetical protein
MSAEPKPDGNVILSASGSTATTYTNNSRETDNAYPWKSLSIINDGNSDLTFTVNNITTTVKSNEEFSDNFENFFAVQINSDIAYRLVIRR